MRPHSTFCEIVKRSTCSFVSSKFGVLGGHRFIVVNRQSFEVTEQTDTLARAKLTRTDMLHADFEPVGKHVCTWSGFRTLHRLSFRLVVQPQAIAHTVNDGIKLIAIIEHVMGY